jgi:hypothetical protein
MAGLMGGLGALGSVGGLAATTLGAPSVSSVQESATTGFLERFNGEASWWTLFLLAGGIPFPPFSYLGYGALNLLCAGSMMYFGIKAALQGALMVAKTYIEIYFPKLWWIGYLLVLNPWYVFDIIQMFSPAFETDGFKVPLLHTPIGEGGTGQMTTAIWMAAFGLMCAGSYNLLDFLPKQIQQAYKPIFNTVMLAIGGFTTLAAGSVGGMVLLPQLISSMKSNVSQASTALSTPDPAKPVQKGGGMPSLENVANKIMNGKIKPIQDGGGSDKPDSLAKFFLGTLALVTLSGISIALVRNKAVSTG